MLRIKELRKDKGLTMKQFGEQIGMAESTISLYEAGKRQPDIETLNKIANYFNVTTDYLLGRTDDRNSRIIEDEPIIIRRLRKGTDKMDEKQQEKMMNILKASFEDLFGDDEEDL